MDYPGVQGNVGQTLSCPSEKDSEPSHVNLCLLGTQNCPEFADGAAFSNNTYHFDPFCRTLFVQETLEQNFKYQLWVQSSIRFEMD